VRDDGQNGGETRLLKGWQTKYRPQHGRLSENIAQIGQKITGYNRTEK
jgi:hypothetical protein